MNTSEATTLIHTELIDWDKKPVWADLGCGSGVFTHALADLLAPGSIIHAVDKDFQDLRPVRPGVVIEFKQADFISDQLNLSGLDGLILANSLHYVLDKPAFFDKLGQYLKKDGCIIIVEYDTDQANPWIPFPISYNKLQSLLKAITFGQIEKTGTRKSIYGSRELYACVVLSVA